MIRSRRAIRIAILYSMPLLIWLTSELRYIEWDALSLRLLFRQLWVVLMLLQVVSLALIFASRQRANSNDDLLAVALVLLYPLPFLALVWLTGSAPFAALFKGCAIVAAAAAVAILLQRCAALFSPALRLTQTGLVSLQIVPAVVIWNFRQFWLGWLGA